MIVPGYAAVIRSQLRSRPDLHGALYLILPVRTCQLMGKDLRDFFHVFCDNRQDVFVVTCQTRFRVREHADGELLYLRVQYTRYTAAYDSRFRSDRVGDTCVARSQFGKRHYWYNNNDTRIMLCSRFVLTFVSVTKIL